VGMRGRGGGEEGWEGQKVAAAGRAGGDEVEDFRDEALLDGCFLGFVREVGWWGGGWVQVGCRIL